MTTCSSCGRELDESSGEKWLMCPHCKIWMPNRNYNKKSMEVENKMTAKKTKPKKEKVAKTLKVKKEKVVKEKKVTKVARIDELNKDGKSPAEIVETIKKEFNCKMSEGTVKASLKYLADKKK